MATAHPTDNNSNQLIQLSYESQNAILAYLRRCAELGQKTWDYRNRFEQIDREYYRENLLQLEGVIGRSENRRGDKKKIADVIIPIVEPQIETGLSYLTSIFCTGQPIFGIVSDPNSQQAARTMEAMVAEQSVRGAWVRQMMLFFRDTLKYNISCLEVCWWQERTYKAVTSTTDQGNKTESTQIIWQGNRMVRRDMYNVLFDIRVNPGDMHKDAEFVGYTELMGRVKLARFLQSLPSAINKRQALQADNTRFNKYYIPSINWEISNLTRANLDFDWMLWATGVDSNTIRYKNIAEISTYYCRIIPSDFKIKVPAANVPQIWKFCTVNDQVLCAAEKQTNTHDYLPMLFCQAIEDGLGYQTKSQASRLIPIQDTASALWNLRLAAKRRSVADRALYDPSRVSASDLRNASPDAKIPVRASAYDKGLGDAYYQIPFEDRDSNSLVMDANAFMQFSNYLSGQNPAQQGQFVKGNKTEQEFNTVMGNSSGRQEMMAWMIESQTLTPCKEIILKNNLQYSVPGPVYSTVDKTMYQVDPVQLQQAAMQFKVADGLVPKSKLINGDVATVALQTISAVPQLQAAYNLGGLFSYVMSTQGFDLTPFEIQTQLTSGSPNVVASAKAAQNQQNLTQALGAV